MFDFNDFEKYIKNKYNENPNLIRFGRLPVHETIKIWSGLYGEKVNLKPKTEYPQKYWGIGSGRNRKGRLDICLLNKDEIVVAIEIEEGISYKDMKKLYNSKTENKIIIVFDMRKKILKNDQLKLFIKNIKLINLDD